MRAQLTLIPDLSEDAQLLLADEKQVSNLDKDRQNRSSLDLDLHLLAEAKNQLQFGCPECPTRKHPLEKGDPGNAFRCYTSDKKTRSEFPLCCPEETQGNVTKVEKVVSDGSVRSSTVGTNPY